MNTVFSDPAAREQISDLLDCALAEDLGAPSGSRGKGGDCTSNALFSAVDTGRAVIRSKENGVLSGAYLCAPLFAKIDPSLSLTICANDGDPLAPGTEICRLSGRVQSILAGERTALNFLQHCSGIATLTSRYVAAIRHTGATILDTRKTTPGLRLLEKTAVRHGGGMNHRSGLFDMVLIKNTHCKQCGGVTAALTRALRARGTATEPKIEIEVQTLREFAEALRLHPDRIMLDNMSVSVMRACVEKIPASSGAGIELEASGNITLDTVAAVAETGVDFISCGAITHSAPALDIHLIME